MLPRRVSVALRAHGLERIDEARPRITRIDDIIDPRDTRPRLIDALETMRAKRDTNPPRKHGNIPL